MTRAEWLKAAASRLAAAHITESAREAELLFSAALGLDAMEARLRKDKNLSDEEIARLESWLARREKREPLARIRGTKEFWRAYFTLNEATLEPRADSETLIETALEFFSSPLPPGGVGGGYTVNIRDDIAHGEANPPLTPPEGRGIRILDLGTGTGCLLLSLLQEFPHSTGLGTDKSARALEAAGENARALGLEDRAQFSQADWGAGLSEAFHLIVSNPPYIESATVQTLQPEVKDFDPSLALDGGEDGLTAYRALAALARKHLAHQGIFLAEIGQGQEEAVAGIFEAAGLKLLTHRRDLGGIIRVLGFHIAP